MLKPLYFHFCLLLALLGCTACGPDKDKARFKGKLDNISDAEFYAYSEDGTSDRIDTIRITDGTFSYERKTSEPVLLTLLYPNFTQSQVILHPGETVEMKGDASKIGEASITGTPDNELLTEFRQANASTSATNSRLAAAEFVRSHASSLAALAVFKKFFANVEQPDARYALPLLDELLKSQPDNQALKRLNATLRPVLLSGAGQMMPSFTAKAIDGRYVSNADYAGKQYLVVSFATWNSHSVAFLRQVKAALRETGMKPWDCLIISLDASEKACRDMMKQDSLHWTTLCDEQMFRSPLVLKLGIHLIPSCILVNSQGRIIARNVADMEQLRQKLRQ